ncbi:hypothetical protein HALDL1_15940 [Halobacterium sp. DL1]|jgi:hypothetical protein|nr:hypothetical protein HALDL1_15940 [Halobacterium sp. DL1]
MRLFFGLQENQDDSTGDEYQNKQGQPAARMVTRGRLKIGSMLLFRLDVIVIASQYIQFISNAPCSPRPFPGIPEN